MLAIGLTLQQIKVRVSWSDKTRYTARTEEWSVNGTKQGLLYPPQNIHFKIKKKNYYKAPGSAAQEQHIYISVIKMSVRLPNPHHQEWNSTLYLAKISFRKRKKNVSGFSTYWTI